MKKRLLAFLVTVFTLICMALPAYAEEGTATPPSPRRLDVQLVQVSLRDSGNTVHQNNLYDGSSFFLNMTWDATETVHTGDYFDILVPESVDMSSDKLDLMARGRHKVRTYLNNVQKEYNSGYEELTDIKLSNKTELFDKWDWKYC